MMLKTRLRANIKHVKTILYTENNGVAKAQSRSALILLAVIHMQRIDGLISQ